MTRPDLAPPRGSALVAEAIAMVSAATGLTFIDDGATTEAPTETRPVYQPERYGDRWAPVLIAWADEAEVPALAGNVAGEAGPVWVTTSSGDRTYLSGVVHLVRRWRAGRTPWSGRSPCTSSVTSWALTTSTTPPN